MTLKQTKLVIISYLVSFGDWCHFPYFTVISYTMHVFYCIDMFVFVLMVILPILTACLGTADGNVLLAPYFNGDGAPRFELRSSWSIVKCSSTELLVNWVLVTWHKCFDCFVLKGYHWGLFCKICLGFFTFIDRLQ